MRHLCYNRLNMLGRILIGLALMGLGCLIVWRTGGFVDVLGRSAWAEDKLGPGGTISLYKFVGVGIVFIGILIAAQLHEQLLGGIASIFIPGI